MNGGGDALHIFVKDLWAIKHLKSKGIRKRKIKIEAAYEIQG